MDDASVKRRITFNLRMTKMELLHLRDLFNVALPPDMKVTVSQSLAQSQERSLVESRLWQKLVAVCRQAELPLDESAPDFVVSVSGVPALGVFELAHEPKVQVEKADGLVAALGQALGEKDGED